MRVVASAGIFVLLASLFFWSETSPQSPGDEIVGIVPLLSKSGVHPGEEFKVALQLKIRPGWHINAHELADKFLFPSSLSLEESENFKTLDYYYPKPRMGRFEYSESELAIYEGEIVFGAAVEPAKNIAAGPYQLKGKLLYQACDSRSCLPPKEVKFEINLDVVPASQEIKEINPEVFSKIEFKKKEPREVT